MELSNNTILVTGGSAGLGLALAERFARLGNTVIITGRSESRLAAAKAKVPALHTFQSDVSEPDAVVKLHREVTTRFPDLNILVNNAGIMRKLVLQDPALADLRDLTREVETNLMGPMRMVQQFLPHLKTKRAAAIVNVTSGLAMVPFPLAPFYGATKAGLRSYTKALRVQLAGTSIKVFELLPPAVDTPLNDQFLQVEGFDPKAMTTPEKVVDAAMKGLRNDTHEIYPGLSRAIRILSRVAPRLVLAQTSKVGVASMAAFN